MNLDWLSLLIGVLIGWIIEWLIDLFYWRRKNADLVEAEAALRRQLSASEDTVRRLQADLAAAEASYQSAIDDLNAQLAAARSELDSMNTRARGASAELSNATAELDTLRTQLFVVSAENEELRARVALLEAESAALLARVAVLDVEPVDVPLRAIVVDIEPEDVRPLVTVVDMEPADLGSRAAVLELEPEDDLAIIEGIGPKIAAYLNQRGIRTFAQLAAMDADEVHALLKDGGPGIASANPETWRRQAELAARHGWAELMLLQASIGGSARQATRAAEVEREDNLSIVEGIGPKIEAVLKANDIRTFGQLAMTEPDQIKDLLTAAGPQFNMADPASWPLQAGLAFEGLWERLEELQESLRAGRLPG